ncbi:oligosaccharide flippase family protein [Acinetobacter sp. YZS-X1-1]|uniref:oligosaccharide flippase family protein n=1 Tax=Acinetobacter sp. YZS-X1-1 TaxID=1501691 RepID=UPI00054CC836|nr:oligosaccharide flippase family protein [Acinetobacter sp. YZS-X1-1]
MGKLQQKYFRYFFVIFSGGVLAQVIYFTTIPIIARIYSVEQFSHLSVFTSLLILLSTIACFRYEVAISLAEKESDILRLFLLSIILSTAFSILLLLIILILYFFGIIDFYLVLLPIAVWLCSISNSVTNFYLKYKDYKKVSSLKVWQISSMSLSQIALGSFFPALGSISLVLGQVLNYAVGSLFQVRNIISIKKISFDGLKEVALKYSYYLKYSTLDSIFNLLGLHLPIILLTTLYDSYEMGIFYMAMRLIQTPVGILISSVSQIYYSNIQENINEAVFNFTIKVVFYLLISGILGFSIFYIIQESLVTLILGSKWLGLIDLSVWLLPWFLLQLISSPISTVMYALNKHKQMMFLTLFGLLIRVLPIIILINSQNNFIIEAFGIANAVYYFVCLFFFLYFAKINSGKL